MGGEWVGIGWGLGDGHGDWRRASKARVFILTPELIDDLIPVVEAFTTWFTVGYLTGCTMRTGIAELASHAGTADTGAIPATL